MHRLVVGSETLPLDAQCIEPGQELLAILSMRRRRALTPPSRPARMATGGTIAAGINDKGQIVGSYNNSTGAHGFLYDHGVYTTLDDPLGTLTGAVGISDEGQIVGAYC